MTIDNKIVRAKSALLLQLPKQALFKQNLSCYQSGFTLIEILIVIGILSILVAVAMPSYVSYVQQGKNSDALAKLAGLSATMEKNYLDFRKYTNADGDCTVAGSSNDDYTFSCTSSGQNYTLSAKNNSNDYQYTIDEKYIKKTLIYAGKGTTEPNNCWMISSGTCQ